MTTDKIIDKILATKGAKKIVSNTYIPKPVREDLKNRGYKIEESRGVYTIKW